MPDYSVTPAPDRVEYLNQRAPTEQGEWLRWGGMVIAIIAIGLGGYAAGALVTQEHRITKVEDTTEALNREDMAIRREMAAKNSDFKEDMTELKADVKKLLIKQGIK